MAEASLHPSSQDISADDSFRKMIGLSVIFHVAVFVIFGVRLAFFSSEPLEIQPSIRVDMVALPDKVISQSISHEAKEIEKPKPEPKPIETHTASVPKPLKPTVNLKKPDLKEVKRDQEKALEKLRAMEAVDSIMHEESKPKVKPSPHPSVVTKGNVLAAGTSLQGLNKIDYNQYLGDLDAHVKSNWNLPEWLQNHDLHARAVVYLDAQGNVIGRRIIQSSGNPQFDSYVTKAIDDSSPFPKPPEKFTDILRVNGITFGFPD